MTAPIKLLVTGFGPFPGVPFNPSGQLIKWLDERSCRFGPDIEFRTALVPTVWTAAEKLVTGPFADFDPDIAIHFGVSCSARGFRVEKHGRNCVNISADADRRLPGRSCVVPGAAQTLRATIDAEKIVHKLRARSLPAAVSISAGRYLCNALLYLSLKQAEDNGRVRQTGFVHIPPLVDTSRGTHRAFDRNTLARGCGIIVEHCISVHRRRAAMEQAA